MRKIAIVGTADGWNDYDRRMEVWCLAKMLTKNIYPQKVFAFDGVGVGIPDLDVEVVDPETFPFKEIGIDYYTNTICYMIALGVYEQVE